MRTLVTILPLLCGCAHVQDALSIDRMPPEARQPTQSEQAIAEAVLSAWQARDDLAPAGEACREKLRDWRVVVGDEETFRELCGKCSPHSDAGDCLHYGMRGYGTSCLREQCWGRHSVRDRCYETPVVVMHRDTYSERTIAKEWFHITANCAPGYEGGNPHYHQDPRIFGAGGVARSAVE